MNRGRTVHLSLSVLLLSGLAGCGGKATEDAPPAATAQVEVQAAAVRGFDEIVVAYGSADFSASATSSVPVPVEAQVEALLARAGSAVRRGQPLMRLVPSPTTRLDLDKARRDARLADAEVARFRRLRGEGLATESELETAITAAGTAASLRDSLVARVGPDAHRTLVAPRDGIVDLLTVQPGDVLAAGSVAARVASKDALKIRLGLEPDEVPRVRIGQRVRLTAVDRSATAIEGRVADLDLRIDPQTRQAAVVIQLSAVGDVLPGTVLRGEIVVASRADAVAVPASALMIAEDGTHLFVAVDGKAHQRAVKTGLRDGDAVEITEGLKAGEAIVTTGTAVLEDGMALTTAAASKPEAAAP